MMEGSYSFSSYHNGPPGREKDFQKLAQTIGTSIQKIQQNVSSMQKMVNQMGTSQDSRDLRSKLQQIQHYTQQLVKDTSANLKELTGLSPSPSTPGHVLEPLLKKRNSQDDRQWKIQKERLSEEFTATLNMFQATQRLEAEKQKEQMRRARASSGLGDPFGGGGRYSEQLIELQDSSGQQDAQMFDEMNLQMLEEQEQAIRQLESDISDVNQIFKELGAMVHEQGEVIDSIEASVEKTEVSIGEGARQLRQASNYQTKLRKKKCILATCLTVILAVIIGIIIWQFSN